MKHFLFSATFEMICDTPYIVQESGKERSIKSFFCQMSTFVYTVCKHFGETHHHSWHHNCLQSLWHLEESQCVCASPPPASSMSTDEMSFLEYVALMALPFMKPLCGRNQAYKSVKNMIFVRTLMALKLHTSIEVFRILKDVFLKQKIKQKVHM